MEKHVYMHNDAEAIRIRHMIRGIVIRPAWAARMARKFTWHDK